MHSFVKQSLIPLPAKLQSKKAIINVQNRNDNKYLKWSLRAALFPALRNPQKKFKTCVYSFEFNFDSAAKDEIIF